MLGLEELCVNCISVKTDSANTDVLVENLAKEKDRDGWWG